MTVSISVIGHRGWPGRFPDNTLAGFLAASAVCDGVEVDVRRTGDGKLALAHDPHLGELEVATTPWSQLGEVDLGSGVKPCLLDEALSSLPSSVVLIEIKNTPGMAGYEPDHRLALESAERTRPSDAVISFNWASVDAVHRSFPEVRTGLDVGLLGDLDEAIRHCFDVGHGLLVPDVDLLLQSTTEVPEELDVYVWSTRRGETFEGVVDELVSRGVSSIIGDEPEATSRLLRDP